ncbi:hypothetical protein TNIN_256931 [Trichonephila inaurata madagascariensis]|uniref:Uncharacterized protein n=1 Tax=Trichonephila inaurata madagascariensis TaxID=2747483 RepID=A0A8X6IKT0_9ARAC|nr:hypothetical protein TNIN_256931 [Trichonephila inaurata madagascariensis]
MHVTDDTVFAVCECLPNLQEFIIRYNHEIDQCIVKIFQLQNLVKLDLSYNLSISGLSYILAMSFLETFNQKYLNLAYSNISDEELFKLLERNPNIRYLNTSGSFFIRFADLENLSLIACRGLVLNNDFEMELKRQNPCL